MVVLATVVTVLFGPLGVLALAIFALIAVLPQSALTLAARTRPVARLDALTATRRYANALALHLGPGSHRAAPSRPRHRARARAPGRRR